MSKIDDIAKDFCNKHNLSKETMDLLIMFGHAVLDGIRNKEGRPKKYATEEEAYQAHLERQRQYRKQRSLKKD